MRAALYRLHCTHLRCVRSANGVTLRRVKEQPGDSIDEQGGDDAKAESGRVELHRAIGRCWLWVPILPRADAISWCSAARFALQPPRQWSGSPHHSACHGVPCGSRVQW